MITGDAVTSTTGNRTNSSIIAPISAKSEPIWGIRRMLGHSWPVATVVLGKNIVVLNSIVSGCMNRVTHLYRARGFRSRLATIPEDRELLIPKEEEKCDETGPMLTHFARWFDGLIPCLLLLFSRGDATREWTV